MILISGSRTFLSRGAIVFDDEELETVIYALIMERNNPTRTKMSASQIDELIDGLREHQKERQEGAWLPFLFLKNGLN